MRERLILALLLVLAWWPIPITVAGQPAQPPPDAGPVLTIFPFTNLTGDPADAWIGAGIAEALAADLGAKAAALTPDRRPPGTLFIDGAYQRLGTQIRITARLVEIGSGRVIRAVKLDGRRDELFALQDRLEGAIEAIGVHRCPYFVIVERGRPGLGKTRSYPVDGAGMPVEADPHRQ